MIVICPPNPTIVVENSYLYRSRMGKFWRYYIALLLGVWFAICSQSTDDTPVAYNINITYNWRSNLLLKNGRPPATVPKFSKSKGTVLVHHTPKRWLKDTESFILVSPIRFFLASAPWCPKQNFFTSEQSFLSSAARLNYLRGPPVS